MNIQRVVFGLVAICVFYSAASGAPWAGGGVEGDPYLIYDACDMQAIGADEYYWDAHFKLMADIDLSAYIGTSFNIIGYNIYSYGQKAYEGTFDGNGHTINNFNFYDPNRRSAGIFGYTSSSCVIKNLNVNDVNVTGDHYVGGLVGLNYGTVENCSITGIVCGAINVGGLIGYSADANVTSCYSTGSVSGYQQVGGLVAGNGYGTITYCYSKASVTGDERVGGLMSMNTGTILSCYSTGSVDGNNSVGGLIGENHGGVIASFWDVNTSSQTTSDGGHGLTTVEMQDEYFYSVYGWSGNVWTLPENDYPHLYWENAGGDYIDDPNVNMAGSGTLNDPWQVASVNDFVAIGSGNYFWDKHYLLISDIDLNDINVNRIGYDSHNTFTGTFDGNGHNILNFRYVDPNQDYVGLFGCLGTNGYIENIDVIDVNIKGSYRVGALVGNNASGTINSCFSTGSVTGDKRVGGLAGHNSRFIMSCSNNSCVNGNYQVGGLAGGNSGIITYCYNNGPVSGLSFIGGLTGDGGVIISCRNSGIVTGSNAYVGGLCGYDYLGDITDCYNNGLINGNDWVGGLAGRLTHGTMTNSYNTGSVIANYAVGGLIGQHDNSTTSACYSSGLVNARRTLGGLVGIQESGMITNCYAIGDVNADTYWAGGLVGEMTSGTITNCYATGSISSGSGSSSLGGLIGYNSGGSVVSSFWDVNSTGQSSSQGGTGKTTAEMQTKGTFTDAGWDFVGEVINGPNDIWDICNGTNYPRLSWWQIPPGDFVCPDGVDFIDFAVLANTWLLEDGDAGYNPICDISEPADEIIDVSDLEVFTENWLEGD